MDSVGDLVGVVVVTAMVAWGWAMTRELREVLFPARDDGAADEVIVLP